MIYNPKDCFNEMSPYTAVIRTLGTAGEKYIREIQSLLKQSFRPKEILAFIPHGYALPTGFDGAEMVKYVRCDKGMIKQRSLPFSEVTTDYILFLDDDLELAENTVEILFTEMKGNDGDCITANVFPNHLMSTMKKIRTATCYLTYPSVFSKYAYKVRGSAHYSYANFPKNVMPSQSGAGACALIKKSVYDRIEFHQERWLEQFVYPLGEDLLFFYKIYKAGYRLLVSYDSGIVHLDSGTGHLKDVKKADYNSKMIWYLLWHRTQYSVSKNKLEKADCLLHYYSSWVYLLFKELASAISLKSLWQVKNRFKALNEARAFAKSENYTSLPPFLIK